jgi:hypothetical protein
MEIAGQYYVRHLHPEQKILVVRLGGISDHGKPGRRFSRLWNSHPDLAGLLRAFIECDAGAPAYWTAFGVSNNVGEPYSHPLFNFVNPYGFTPQDNAFERQDGV